MNLESIKEIVGEISKDAKLNLSSVLRESGAPGLKQNQILSIALACAYSVKDPDLITAITKEAEGQISNEEVKAAQTASALMAMNNIYYRFIHLSEDPKFSTLPAKLRMTAIGNPGIDKTDFELYSLAISALAGCGACINSHAEVLKNAGVGHEGIQSAVRIASVINSVAQTLSIRRVT